jgi:hypothetical protein
VNIGKDAVAVGFVCLGLGAFGGWVLGERHGTLVIGVGAEAPTPVVPAAAVTGAVHLAYPLPLCAKPPRRRVEPCRSRKR